MAKKLVVRKAGNIAGLAKHLAKKYGGDPSFFTKCMAASELQGYDDEARKGICAKAHKLATGRWPAEDPDNKQAKEDLTFTLDPLFKMTSDGIVINSEENADWMHSLPGYKSEIQIHEDLAKKYEEDEQSGDE